MEGLDKKEELRSWLVGQQYRRRHPYTGADPGGFSWTPLPGGVPDADDTPGAILAITSLLQNPDPTLAYDIRQYTWPMWFEASDWLFCLQNRDGGIPTFCRGWG